MPRIFFLLRQIRKFCCLQVTKSAASGIGIPGFYCPPAQWLPASAINSQDRSSIKCDLRCVISPREENNLRHDNKLLLSVIEKTNPRKNLNSTCFIYENVNNLMPYPSKSFAAHKNDSVILEREFFYAY